MFVTQIYGTVLGAFVNYGVMISIVNNNKEILLSSNGDASWSGATTQAYNTNAISWALAKYLYKTGSTYDIVPIGLAIGAGLVILHRVVVHVSSVLSLCDDIFFFLTKGVLSSSPKSAACPYPTLISPNSSNTPDSSPTTSLRPVLSLASYFVDSLCNSTCATTNRASSGTIRIWSQAPLTGPV
jgi:hypothetical protein